MQKQSEHISLTYDQEGSDDLIPLLKQLERPLHIRIIATPCSHIAQSQLLKV